MGPPKRSFSRQQIDEMVNRYLAGESAQRIAPDFSCSYALVVRQLRERGVVVTRRAFSPAEESEVVAAYRAGESANSIATRSGVGHTVVCDALRRAGVAVVRTRPGRRRALSPAEERRAVERYLEGASARHVAADFGVTKTCIRDMLKRAGVPPRSTGGSRQHDLNESAFDDAERSPAACYYLGLLLADGSASFGRSAAGGGTAGRIYVSLSGEDGDHLKGLQGFLQTSVPLAVRPPRGRLARQPTTRLTIDSQRLATKAAEYGIVPAKTLREVADPRLAGSAAFWAGVIDGDGALYWVRRASGRRYPVLSLSGGSEVLMRQFSSFASGAIGGDLPRVKATTRDGYSPVYTVALRGARAAAAARLLYTGDWPMLPRKKRIADEMMLWEPARRGGRQL